jgi:regulator of RNase E activity RraA
MTSFDDIPVTTLAEVLGRSQVMDPHIRPLWTPVPHLAGPAYPVRCGTDDNLMLHAAIYRAPAGSVIVVEGPGVDYAAAGGNVCAVAQRRGIAGFVVDGVVRDIGEIRDIGFPVFGRGLMPVPGDKKVVHPLDVPVTCAGVTVNPGDIVVADEDGVVVIPATGAVDVGRNARARLVREAAQSLDDWETAHHARVEFDPRRTRLPGLTGNRAGQRDHDGSG